MEEEEKTVHERFSVQTIRVRFEQELYNSIMRYDSKWRVVFLTVSEQSQKEVAPSF